MPLDVNEERFVECVIQVVFKEKKPGIAFHTDRGYAMGLCLNRRGTFGITRIVELVPLEKARRFSRELAEMIVKYIEEDKEFCSTLDLHILELEW